MLGRYTYMCSSCQTSHTGEDQLDVFFFSMRLGLTRKTANEVDDVET